MTDITGYLHPGYAQSLAEFGTPSRLPNCKGWVLERKISGLPERDAMGPYPLFCCQDWAQLHVDLEDIKNQLVSLSLVADPFGDYDLAYLEWCFRDVVTPFKEHFVVDLSCPTDTFVCQHHRRYAKKALRAVCVERCENPIQFLHDWVYLYATLIEKHSIKGLLAFSESAFRKQLSIPGIVVFRALHESTTVSMLLWYVQGDIAYYHLGASSEQGYELKSSFALFWSAIEYFAANGLRWLNLGAGAGVKNDGTDGLSRFKRGWATGTRTTYFCGRIFDHVRYLEIVEAKDISDTGYFPAYRRGEFG